jgi:hypothetical protein
MHMHLGPVNSPLQRICAVVRSSLSPSFNGERVARTGRSEPGEGLCTAPHPARQSASTSPRIAGRGERKNRPNPPSKRASKDL